MGGWDTHENNFNKLKSLGAQLDSAFSALILDLKERDLWQDTLVVWIGDFGRTPTINGRQGRDHFPRVSNVVLAGGMLPGGVVVGKTNASGSQIEIEPVSTADVFATVLHQFGISPDQQYQTAFGSPTEATDGGEVIPSLA